MTVRARAGLLVAVAVGGLLVAPAPARADGSPWLETSEVLDLLSSVSRLPDSYQVERMASNGRFAVTVGRDASAGLTRVTTFVDGGVTSDVVTAEGRGVWTALDQTPEVQSELDYLSRTTARWTYSPDADATVPPIVAETSPARVLSVLPGPGELDYIPVTKWTYFDSAHEPLSTSYSIPFDLRDDPVTGKQTRRMLLVDTGPGGALQMISLWEPDDSGTVWQYSQAVGVVPPDPGSVVDASDVERAAAAVAAARREAHAVAVAANALARAQHRRTRVSDLTRAARQYIHRHKASPGLRVTAHPSRGTVTVSVTDQARGRTTARTVWVDGRGRATTRLRR